MIPRDVNSNTWKKSIFGAMVGIVAASGYMFSERSINNVREVHFALQAVTQCALSHSAHDFVVVDGKRSLEEHKLNLLNGKSWTRRSKHIDGLAVDVAAYDGGITWETAAYPEIAASFYYCSEKLNTPIIWGGEWKVRDLGHFECKYADCAGKP